MSNNKPKSISQKQLIGTFGDIKKGKSSENRFCFLLGAGASKSSGILTGGELATKWYERIKNELTDTEREKWEKDVDFDEDNIEASYPDIYQKRFEASPQGGYEELIALMESEAINSSVGYTILAQILAKEKHNFVITTNFDQLVEDAVRMYTNAKPLVVGHEVLADFISTQSERPTIIKIHRDLYLHPINDERTNTLDKQWKRNIKSLLKNCNLLVVGYGGNDGSLMNYLKSVDASKRNPIYWCVRAGENLNTKIKELLTEKDYFIEIKGFDELMINLNEELNYQFFTDLGEKKIEDHDFIISSKNKIIKLKSDLIELLYSENSPSGVRKLFKGALDYVLKAQEEQDKDKANDIYSEGLKEYPEDGVLLVAYAGFLFNVLAKTKSGKEREELYNKADEKYKEATELNPNYYQAYNNWGGLLFSLAEIKGREEAKELYNEAIKKYKKAIELNPNHPQAYNNWGASLNGLAKIIEGRAAEDLYNEAIKKYEKAIELDPKFTTAYNNWGVSLNGLAEIKEGEEVEKFYKQAIEKYIKAVEINPNYSEPYYNWGGSLNGLAKIKEGEEVEKFYKQAIEKYEKAVEINPNYSEAYYNFGVLLADLAKIKEGKEREKLYNEAIKKYKKAIELNPNYYQAYNNWAVSLVNLAKLKEGGEAEDLYNEAIKKYKKVIELNPNYYQAYNNWGVSLVNLAQIKEEKEVEDLYNEAIKKYEKAIGINPNYYRAYNNLGYVLGVLAQTKAIKEAEKLYKQAIKKYKKAIELNPEYANAYYNFGNTLIAFGKTLEKIGADKLYKQEISEEHKKMVGLNPKYADAYNYLLNSLAGLAKTKEREEAEGLYKQAIEKHVKAIELGFPSYNIGYIYAEYDFIKEALYFLDIALERGEVLIEDILKNAAWQGLKDDPEFKKLIKTYRKKE